MQVGITAGCIFGAPLGNSAQAWEDIWGQHCSTFRISVLNSPRKLEGPQHRQGKRIQAATPNAPELCVLKASSPSALCRAGMPPRKALTFS